MTLLKGQAGGSSGIPFLIPFNGVDYSSVFTAGTGDSGYLICFDTYTAPSTQPQNMYLGNVPMPVGFYIGCADVLGIADVNPRVWQVGVGEFIVTETGRANTFSQNVKGSTLILMKVNATDWIFIPNNTWEPIPIAYADLQTLKAASGLNFGRKYLITDVADTGVLVEAVSKDKISLRAEGGFLNPDFQGTGQTVIASIGNYFYSPDAPGGFINGETVNFSPSGASARLIHNTGTVSVVTDFVGTFVNGDTMTGATSGAFQTNVNDRGVGLVVGDDFIDQNTSGYGKITSLTLISGSEYLITYDHLAGTPAINTDNVITKVPDSTGGAAWLNFYSNTGQVWHSSLESGWSNGDIVIWNGLHYLIVDDAAFAGTDPATNSTAYLALPKSKSGYIEEWDEIEYDFDANVIISRADKRGNFIKGNSVVLNIAINNFQWGNEEVVRNKLWSGVFECMNSHGRIWNNTIFNSNIICNETNFGLIDGNIFEDCVDGNISKDDTRALINCTIKTMSGFTLDPTSLTEALLIAEPGFSNFTRTIDITGLTTLDLGTDQPHVGLITLTSTNPTENLDTIVNPIKQFDFTLFPAPGLVLTLTGTAMASMSFNKIALPTPTIVLVGDSTDWIRLKQKGTMLVLSFSEQVDAQNYL